MYTYDEVRHVHIEPTTRCNAACPMCARNARGKTIKGLKLTELTLSDVRTILPAEFLSRIEAFDACGAYGDPAAAPELAEIVGYVRGANSSCKITIYTNGGIRSADWWEAMAHTLGKPATVIFSIDGLHDTNSIHRRGVNFEKVIENARAFIGAGGDARWEFLAFRHNEHQIQAALELSTELGFKEFSVKKSGRFLEPAYDYIPEYEDHDELTHFPIFDQEESVVGYLEPPSTPALVNESVRKFDEIIRHHSSLDALFSRTPIDCRVANTRSVFISAQGYVFPCCWTYVQATRPLMGAFPSSADYQVVELLDRTGGFDSIDARSVGLRAAIESPFFDAIERSWSCKSVGEGRLRICARSCGRDFPAYFNQFTAPNLVPRGLQSQATEAKASTDDLYKIR